MRILKSNCVASRHCLSRREITPENPHCRQGINVRLSRGLDKSVHAAPARWTGRSTNSTASAQNVVGFLLLPKASVRLACFDFDWGMETDVNAHRTAVAPVSTGRYRALKINVPLDGIVFARKGPPSRRARASEIIAVHLAGTAR